MWQWHDGPDGWGALWMLLMMSFVWLPILLIVIWGLRGFSAPTARHEPSALPPQGEASDAREIARQTYARGDVDRDRFLQIIEDLDHTDE
ncbi:MAG: hypothetical protein HOH95_04685 [Dehalococcoidia bacterium]|jgi:uncharacterized membrane protein|nr:hypothetical protein [Dehalococcoidia bacterium]